MPHATFLQDLALVMIVAGIVTVLFRQLRQPVVLGYILAGVIIGPHTPHFLLVKDDHTITTLSELGIIFLMFSLGLEFSLRKLKKVGATAFIAATFEILLMVGAGFQLGQIFGWRMMDSVFLGAMLAISSTTIIIKALEELGKTKAAFAELIFGILIVEDILAIVMIALLSGFAKTGSLEPAEVAKTVLQLSAFLGVLLVAGLIAVPRLLSYVARFKSDEMLLVTVVGLCFGVSLLALTMGYSVALGAFLIGAIIAEARQIAKIEALMHPVRDLFSAVFFVSIGLLIDPKLLLQYAGPILIITVVVVVGKVITCSFGTFVSGHDQRTSMQVGMGLAQIGEFSFIIATLGLTLNVTSGFLYPIAVAVSALTTLLTPYLIRYSDAVVERIDRVAPAPLTAALEAYTRWVGGWTAGDTSIVKKMLRRWTWQIALNLLLIMAIFIAAGWLKSNALAWNTKVPGGDDGVKAILWIAAMVLSLPLIIACVRKLVAFGMLISEVSVTREAGGEKTDALRSIVSSVVFGAGCLGLLLLVLLLSSAILPSLNLFIAGVLIVVVAAVLLWRSSIRVYARAQIALRDTLSQPAVPRHHAEVALPLPALLRDASLRHVEIAPHSSVAGQLIGELRLRSRFGASIVGIERAGESLVNPGPDEELKGGDRVLLLGSEAQLLSAEQHLGANG